MKKKLILIGIATLFVMASSLVMVAYGQSSRVHKMTFSVVDEFGSDLDWTTLTSVTIYNAGTTNTKTIYSDPGGLSSKTNPIVSGLSTPVITFYCREASYKVTATDGTYTRTVDNMTGSDNRLFFPSYLPAVSAAALSDAQSTVYGTDSDWAFNAADSTMDLTPAADNSALAIGTASYTSDLLLYGGTSGYNVYWDASEDTLELLDNVTLAVGTGDDFTISHNGTTTTVAGAATYSGAGTFSTDVTFDGTYDVKWDDSRNQLSFADNAVLGIGGADNAAGDVTIKWDASNMLIESAAEDTGEIRYGSTNAIDVAHYGNTATNIAKFNANTSTLELNGYDLQLQDGDLAAFGDGDDWTISSSTAKTLDLLGASSDETDIINVGADTDGSDLKLFGATTGEYWLWDASADSILPNCGNALFTMTDAEANQFKVDATGTVAGDAIVLETTDGGVQINADGASNGDIDIDAADDKTITAAGDLTLAITGTVSAGGAAITNQLASWEEITAQTDTITAAESGKIIVGDYTGTQTLTLPDAAAGLIFTFVDSSATAGDDLVIDCQAADTIDGDSAGDAIESVTDALNQSVTLIAIDGTQWITVHTTGTWGQQ